MTASIHDWMKTIRNRGGDSPVIVVINKSDEGKQDLRLDEQGLQEKYQQYRRILANLLRSRRLGGRKHPATARKDRCGHHPRTSASRTFDDPIPANWLQIKHRVARPREVAPGPAACRFRRLCTDPGDGIEPIIDENEQRALLRLLHELGTIVAHGLARDAPATRREVSLLDPNWLTGAVYRILDKARSVDQEGEFLRQQLAEWLDPDPYPPSGTNSSWT